MHKSRTYPLSLIESQTLQSLTLTPAILTIYPNINIDNRSPQFPQDHFSQIAVQEFSDFCACICIDNTQHKSRRLETSDHWPTSPTHLFDPSQYPSIHRESGILLFLSPASSWIEDFAIVTDAIKDNKFASIHEHTNPYSNQVHYILSMSTCSVNLLFQNTSCCRN
jgi:hypothetical protein